MIQDGDTTLLERPRDDASAAPAAPVPSFAQTPPAPAEAATEIGACDAFDFPPPPRHSVIEEIANSLTHGLGAALSVGGLVLLIVATAPANPQAVAAVTAYGVTLILTFFASTLYHSIPHPRAKDLFLLLDHCAIYLLIAGTHTPFALLVVPPEVGWPLFVAIWTCAAAGVAIKVTAYVMGDFGRFEKLSIAVYLAMGWVGPVWGAEALLQSLDPAGLMWLLAGGLLYTAGVVAYVWREMPFNHAVWHLFVLGGGGCHFIAILFYVIPGVR